MSSASVPDRGWGWPLNAKAPHFFVSGRSLCGRWMYYGPLEDARSVDGDCKACTKAMHRLPEPPATPAPEPRPEVRH